MKTTAAEARQQLAEAINACALASAEVAGAREALAVGSATQSDVNKAVRAHARLTDQAENARAALRVVEAREQADRELAARESTRMRAALDEIVRQKAAVESAKYREFLEATRATAEGFNQRIGGYEQQLGSGSIVVPGRFTSYGLFMSAVADQLRHFTRPGFGSQTERTSE